MGETHDSHRDFADRTGGLCHRPDRDCDCRRRNVVGRRADGVRTPRLHDRVSRFCACLRGPVACHRIRRERGSGLNHANDRQAARDRDPPIGEPTEPNPRRGSRTGANRDAYRNQPRIQFGELVGSRPERCVLGRSGGGASTHGEGRSSTPANLHAAYPVQSVLSREKRAAFALRAYPKELEVIHATE